MARGGGMAARGNVNQPLLAELMRHPYFRRRPPKSTGREEFGPQLLDRIVADARHMKIVDYDLVATITALTARSIADACRQFIFPRGLVDQLIGTLGVPHKPPLLRTSAN